MGYQYRNANGEIFGITYSSGAAVAYIKGNYVAQAETDRELEAILDHYFYTQMKGGRD